MPSYYGDERDNSPPPEKKVEKNIVLEPKTTFEKKGNTSVFRKLSDIDVKEFVEMSKNLIADDVFNPTFPPNMDEVKRQIMTLKEQDESKNKILNSPHFITAFNQATATQLPSPPHIGLDRDVRVVGLDFEMTVRALSMERNGKLVWVLKDSIY